MTYSAPFLANSEIDLPKVIFVIIFLVVGFIQWVIKLAQQKKEAAERENQPQPPAEELEARRRAWEQQTAPAPPPVPTYQPHVPTHRPAAPPAIPTFGGSPPMPTFGGPLGELMESMRRNSEEQTKPAAPSRPQLPPTPVREHRPEPAPHVPVYVPPVVAARVPTSTSNSSLDAHLLSQANVTTRANAAYNTKGARRNHPLADLLRTTKGYRQAFVLKEVLSEPKALQKSPWPME